MTTLTAPDAPARDGQREGQMPEFQVVPETEAPQAAPRRRSRIEERAAQIPDETIAERVRIEIERSIRRNIKGLELISTPDPAVGLTPKDTILQIGTMKLYHYRPLADEVYRVPVLFVTSLVSKPYILDLTPGQSMVEYLLRQGFDVFLIDWGIPREEDKGLRIEDYVLDRIPACVAKVMEETGEPDVNIVGYCLGGLMSAMYAALHTEGPLRNLACFTTPVNFDGMGLQRRWLDRRWFDVDRVVDTLGNAPPELFFTAFDLLRPASRVAGQVKLWDNLWNDEFVRSWRMFDRWAADHVPFPGECFRQYVREVIWPNAIVNGTLELRGRRVDLKNVKVPILHVTAEHDHIVPADASAMLVDLVGSEDRQSIVMKGGHVSLVAGGNAVYRLWPQLDRWLSVRSV
jgi:polyhydroxyalkanoate synthase